MIICFDFDNVIIRNNTALLLFERVKHDKEEVFSLTDLILHGLNPHLYPRFLRQFISHLKGLEWKKFEELASYFIPTPNVAKVFRDLKKQHHKVVIITENDKRIVEKYLKKKGLLKYVDSIYALRLGVRKNLLTGKVYGDKIIAEKHKIIPAITKKYNVKRDQLIYIGDGLTDLEMFKRLKSVVFCPKFLTKTIIFRKRVFEERIEKNKLFFVEKPDFLELLKTLRIFTTV